MDSDQPQHERLIETAPLSSRLEHLVFGSAQMTDIDAVAGVFWKARSVAMPWLKESLTPIQIRVWMRQELFRNSEIHVARMGPKPVAFVAYSRTTLSHLYVHPDHQRHGVGGVLLSHVKLRRPAGFDLWVFQKNLPAIDFYQKNGLRLVDTTEGLRNREREPDARYAWNPRDGKLSPN